MKQLLFPGFTDSGANETFHRSSEQQDDITNNERPISFADSNDKNSDEKDEEAEEEDEADTNADISVVGSEATTHVQSNLSKFKLPPIGTINNNGDPVESATAADDFAAVSLWRKKKSPTSSPETNHDDTIDKHAIERERDVHGNTFTPNAAAAASPHRSHLHPPSFFASTKPTNTTTTTTRTPHISSGHVASVDLSHSLSPPRVHRHVAKNKVVGSSMRRNSNDTSKKQSSSPFKTGSTNVASYSPRECKQSKESGSPRSSIQKQHSDSSDAGDIDETSEPPSSPPQAQVAIPSKFDLDDDDDGKINESLQDNESDAEEKRDIDIQWEEEANPAQTAFAKELLFRRKIEKHDKGVDGSDDGSKANAGSSSDVSSTASEMGTVVMMTQDQRLADIEDMEAHIDGNWKEQEQHFNEPSTSMIAKQREDSSAEASVHCRENESDTNSLSLPVLGRSGASISTFSKSHDKSNDEKKMPDRNLLYDTAHQRTSNILSQAIRRMGPGMAGGSGHSSSYLAQSNSRTSNNSQSAPVTPRPVAWSPRARHFENSRKGVKQSLSHDYSSNESTAHTSAATASLSSSFLLRSPGSTAHFNAKKPSGSPGRYPVLSPRFATLQSTRDPNVSRSNCPSTGEAVVRGGSVSRGVDLSKATNHLMNRCFSFDAYGTAMDEQYEFQYTELPMFQQRPTADVPSKSRTTVLSASSSWDVGGNSRGSAFRSSSTSYIRNTPGKFAIHPNTPKQPQIKQRTRNYSDFSAVDRADALELKSPQRIEIEREDALDILACLVERGVSLKEKGGNKTDTAVAEKMTSSETEDCESIFSSNSSLDVSGTVQFLKDLTAKHAAENDDNSNNQTQEVLEELVRSHEYALEMRRVSRSASSWLESIGRSLKRQDMISEENKASKGQPAGECVSEGILDLLTAKALLHSAQLEVKEKIEQADRLNEELAKCRAEIGRLRSAANGGSGFRSPNRSILDEADEMSATEVEDEELDHSFGNTSPIVKNTEAESDFGTLRPLKRGSNEAVNLKSALEEANRTIQRLHAELKKSTNAVVVSDEPPIVKITFLEQTLDEALDGQDERPVNSFTLEEENYTTEWDELSPPLPPPPDHGLRSPIVATVLEQWTKDPNLHHSLISWMEHILSGGDPAAVPPLTLSKLDHQVRDGFTMHVLPLLLRRPDIRVDVKTRTHRTTSYDISLWVDQIDVAPHSPLHALRRLESRSSTRSEVGAESTTNSSTTALINNITPGRLYLGGQQHAQSHQTPVSARLSYDEMADGVAVTADGAHSGIMSALGGALGGLLSLRRPTSAATDAATALLHEPGAMQTIPEVMSPSRSLAPIGVAGSPGDRLSTTRTWGEDDDEAATQPFHRVVTAPPGRLCITFVEYRGHAMVSDVAPESPLVGWIFQSDILIAIDELPVSGMRVRDIIKVLKDRKERPRALRVISSHDMTELTLNTSNLHDGPN